MTIDDILADGAPPIVAILRGIEPEEAASIASALIDAGIRMIEVPLNSPDPFASITAIQQAYGDHALVGGGTVLDVPSVDRLADTGSRIMVTPNIDPAVIARAVARGLEPMPGFVTPSEAFRGIAAGARRLKLFPATALGPAYLKAIRDVLPKDVKTWGVGGTDADNMHDWLAAGAEGVGVGGAIYRPGDDARTVAGKTRAVVAAWRAIAP
ncbi:2-dehydro-3-deoxy-6-phosphogalactonate aldolase [Sphingomonas bacterium]|uniref:2-dehydro-3-deoxy-6-phosphogalactonate aldolase n=1 Tax=Sphingomonas bacterium TaxID=1895847 RepID=UPI001576693B|nr:2-dehydro-3-deoxy-6-phosphogalactonate aldolase [Sphingomonas bacterium]